MLNSSSISGDKAEGSTAGPRSLLLVAGSNSGGQLGLGHRQDSSIFVPARCSTAGASSCVTSTFPPDGTRLVQLSSGANHSLALVGGNEPGSRLEVWGTGENGHGQLGCATQAQQDVWVKLDLAIDLSDTHSLVSVTCGWQASYLVWQPRDRSKDDIVVTLGTNNDFGELGLAKGKPDSACNVVELRQALSDCSAGALRVQSIVAGLRHVAVLCFEEELNEPVSSVALIGWGAARHGQVGDTASAESVAWGPRLIQRWNARSAAPARASGPQVAAGKAHTVALLSSHLSPTVKPNTFYMPSWGSDRKGQCQLASHLLELDDVVPLQLTSNWDTTLALCTTPALDKLRIFGSGNNSKAQLGNSVTDTRTFQELRLPNDKTFGAGGAKLVSGSEHSLLLAEGEVWGWGWNEHGNLGAELNAREAMEQGEEADHRLPSLLWHSALNEGYRVMNIWAGCGTSFILLEHEGSQFYSIE